MSKKYNGQHHQYTWINSNTLCHPTVKINWFPFSLSDHIRSKWFALSASCDHYILPPYLPCQQLPRLQLHSLFISCLCLIWLLEFTGCQANEHPCIIIVLFKFQNSLKTTTKRAKSTHLFQTYNALLSTQTHWQICIASVKTWCKYLLFLSYWVLDILPCSVLEPLWTPCSLWPLWHFSGLFLLLY